MGKAIARHEMIADYLDEMRTDIQAHARARRRRRVPRGDVAASSSSSATFAEVGERPERPSAHERASPRSTAPSRAGSRRSSSTSPTEKAVEIARRNMQIHGGVGYTKEFGAEKLLRDALVLPVYEGTSQIQSLMAMKDTLLGIIKRPQAFVDAHGAGALAVGLGARSARAARRQAADALDVGAAVPR